MLLFTFAQICTVSCEGSSFSINTLPTEKSLNGCWIRTKNNVMCRMVIGSSPAHLLGWGKITCTAAQSTYNLTTYANREIGESFKMVNLDIFIDLFGNEMINYLRWVVSLTCCIKFINSNSDAFSPQGLLGTPSRLLNEVVLRFF